MGDRKRVCLIGRGGWYEREPLKEESSLASVRVVAGAHFATRMLLRAVVREFLRTECEVANAT